MMKAVKKLALSKETLHSLEEDAIRKAVGRDDQTVWTCGGACSGVSYCKICPMD
jgi:hypothetical protein